MKPVYCTSLLTYTLQAALHLTRMQCANPILDCTVQDNWRDNGYMVKYKQQQKELWLTVYPQLSRNTAGQYILSYEILGRIFILSS